MIRVLALCLALFTSAAGAEVAVVKGGEHGDFTRIVIEAAGKPDWRFGRTEDGYELALGAGDTTFDLTAAFEKIPKDRITAVWKDPETGNLRLGLACACHAVAFEFRPGIVVVDIRSGPPPEGSAFEAPLDGATVTTAAEVAGPVPETPSGPAGTYDWLAIARKDGPPPQEMPLPLPIVPVSLDPLRDALLAQISKGVAAGVVEVAKPGDTADPAKERVSEEVGLRVGVGEMPGVAAGDDRVKPGSLTGDGAACLSDESLNVASWGLQGTVASQVGLGRAGLLAEFDDPIPETVLRTVRFHIFLGFGAEALQYLSFLGDDGDAVLAAMAHVVDQDPVPDNPFAGMESCDTAAALWAVLARISGGAAEGKSFPAANTAAIARSFSALPAHLRRHLGPYLVEHVLQQGDAEGARLLRDAIWRAPGAAGPEVALMEAKYHLSKGEDAAASDIAGEVLAESGPVSAEAAITLVDAHLAGDRQVPPDLAQSLAAFQQDARGTALEGPLRRAHILAAAMSDDFETAFAEAPGMPDVMLDLWRVAAERMDDDLFLARAVPAADPPVAMPFEVALPVATRLANLGFDEAALRWLGPVDHTSAEAVRLLAASSHLGLGDAKGAIGLLSGLTSVEAESLRAAAVLQLGDLLAAAESLSRAGAEDESKRTLAWTRDWPMLAEKGADPWQAAAGLVAGPATGGDVPAGPIARGKALVDESAAARATLAGLLDGLQEPPPSQ